MLRVLLGAEKESRSSSFDRISPGAQNIACLFDLLLVADVIFGFWQGPCILAINLDDIICGVSIVGFSCGNVDFGAVVLLDDLLVICGRHGGVLFWWLLVVCLVMMNKINL